MYTRNTISSLFLLGLASQYSDATSSDYINHAGAAVNTLQSWYDTDSGLWNTTGWWNSANCLTMLANLAAVDNSIHDTTDFVFPNTLAQAQQHTSRATKRIMGDMPVTEYEKRDDGSSSEGSGFINGYYDDEGWWALAWIRVYDVTKEPQYLDAAADIFEDMKGGWGTNCGGGIWWDKAHTYVNAIANELFLSVAASLANRKSNKQYYVDWAQKEWNWFAGSGMINAQSTINDGLDSSTCKNNNYAVWSYNQGVVVGGLLELTKATNDTSYADTAKTIASAGIKALSTSKGILRESCEPSCGGDASQFKGVFMRNLQALQQAYPTDEVAQFIQDNALSVWTANRNADSSLGLVWSGPYDNAANASTQSSALDSLVAAATL